MASALQVLSREEINFLRVANLLIRHSPKAVRILFDREFNPSGLKSVLSKNRNKLDKLKKKHVITQTQWNLLFPSGSVPDSSNFDLTLMVCLLRNLTKITIQDKLPQPSDLSEGAAVSRIKFYRNQIAHSDSGAMSDSEFSKTFDEVSMAIEIICPSMKTDCETSKLAHIDHSIHDIYVEFVKNEKQMEEMKQQQEELVAQVEILNFERQNIESIQTEEISDWKKKLEQFYVTKAATRLIKVVKDNQCTIITGVPGSGKSAIAYHVAIHMQETEGYTVVPIWLPSELIKLANLNAKQLFVFDDVFGKYSLNEFNLNCWESETRRIKMLLKNKILKVMVTCRSYLFDNVRDSLSSQSFEQFNLQSDEMDLSLSERKEISKLYLSDDVVSQLTDETVMMYNFFPLLCVMFKEKNMNNADFFQNPNQFIENEIDNFKSTRDLSFMCLALLVLSNNSIEKDCLQIGKDKYDKILQDLFVELDIRNFPSKTSMLLNLQHLKQMYLQETESTFCTKHDKIFDIISRSVGKFIVRCIFRHGESGFISSRCQLESLNERHGDCTIMIEDEFETMYFERILKDIENGYYWEVFASIQMKFEKYRYLLIQYMEKYHTQLPRPRSARSTPLHVTSTKGYYDISKYLLEKNIKLIGSLDERNRSPLHNASMNGHYEIALFLLQNGAKVNQNDYYGYSPLLYGVNGGYSKVAEILLKKHANVHKCSIDSWYPLHIAADIGHTDLINILVKNKAKVNKRMSNGMTPLYVASIEGNVMAVTVLLDYKAKVNKNAKRGWSPLLGVCDKMYNEIAELLLKYGAAVNNYNDTGMTSLHIAAEDGNTDLIKILMNHDADVNFQMNNGMTPIYLACMKNQFEALQFLLIYKADINKCEKTGWSPLHIASFLNHKEVVSYLCDHSDAVVNLSNTYGSKPLDLAFLKGNEDIVKVLLKHGASFNHSDKEGFTPFHKACSKGSSSIVELLINENAAVNRADRNGRTPLYIACQCRCNDVVELLLKHGGDVNKTAEAQSEEGWTPLHVSAASDNTGVTKLLLQNKASVNVKDRNGHTPLYYANSDDVIELLSSYGAILSENDVQFPPISTGTKRTKILCNSMST